MLALGTLADSAGVAEAAGRTIVGKWAPNSRNCLPHAGAIRISALMLVGDEPVCDFTKRTAQRTYHTRAEARADVFDHVELFYNPAERHSTQDYLSLVKFEY